MRGLTTAALLFLFSLFCPPTVYAALMEGNTQWDYSGVYMFTVTGNDTHKSLNGELFERIGDWLIANASDEHVFTSLQMANRYEHGKQNGAALHVFFDDASKTHGTWESGAPIEFYAVKAGKSFALYWLGEGGMDNGFWTSEHVNLVGSGNVPELSHFSTYNEIIGMKKTLAPVPEPSTVILLGFGALLGFIAAHGKRSAAKNT